MIKVHPGPPAQTLADLDQRVRKIEQSINYSEVILAFSAVEGSAAAADDDYPGYLLLAGRSGGQVANGGTAAANSLTLNANSVAFALANAGRVVFGERVTFAPSASTSAALDDAFIKHTGTLTTSNTIFAYSGFDFQPNIDYSASLVIAIAPAFWARPTFRPTTSVADTAGLVTLAGFFGNPFWKPNAAAITPTTPSVVGFLSIPSAAVVAGTSGTITNLTAYASFADATYNGLATATVGANITATNVRGLHHGDPAKHASGAITNNIAVDVQALTQGSTLACALRSAITASTTVRWFLQSTGDAPSSFGGPVYIGGTTPTVASGSSVLHVDGGYTMKRRAISNVNDSILITDYYVGQSGTMSASRTWTLPTVASAGAGKVLMIKDENGSVSGANTLIVDGNGAETIDGAANVTLNTAYAWVIVVCTGTAWAVIGRG